MKNLPFPQITTERLILRKFAEKDTDAVFNAFSVSSFTENMFIDKQPDRFFAEAYISELIKAYENNSGFTWAISLRDNDKCIGAISFEKINSEHDSVEIGYWIADENKCNGYATEAVKAIVRYAFEYMHMHRVSAQCSTKNNASMHVLKKAGFEIEGIAHDSIKHHGQYVSIAWFGIINK